MCGDRGYDCVDPNYLEDDYPHQSSYTFSCDDDRAGNGYCDHANNFEECGML